MIGIGLLIIRLAIGITMMGHGCQKLFGWFGGGGPVGFAQWLKSLGIERGGRFWSIAAGLFELVGGFLFCTGFLTAVGAALISVVMMDAIAIVHRKNGFWIDKGGFEYTFMLIVVTIGIALIGPGPYVLFPS
ncbi:DoxX family protein [Alicyclobacillus cycloheptanicus]|uniref:DoxX family protein n=1 Tax=Alicyclobacillus cycloheptanicus TaxID=1457 RepID=UPI0023788B76|nr:DoxX family protein [Alicyclobacillus cycloheptanicus]WDM02896.1 DoxX family protein [Alicyclobacillus cycloheptanicus]